MYSQISFSGLLLLWMCLLLLIAQLVVVIKARTIETEHGLRRTGKRVALVAGLTAGMAVLVLATSYLAFVQPTPPLVESPPQRGRMCRSAHASRSERRCLLVAS